MKNLKSILVAIAIAAISYPAAAVESDAQSSLSVTFTGIEEQQGAVMGVLFDSEAAYNGKGAPVRQIMVNADKTEVAAMLEGLAPGTYAIKSYHDIDGDHKMGTNPNGTPIEPFAFSNNAQGNMGPAKWADAKFEVKAGANTHRIIIQ